MERMIWTLKENDKKEKIPWIKKNYFFLLLPLFLGIISADVIPLTSQEKTSSALNVLLITIDTLRADRLSCYGSQNVKTPHIDSLAEKGILFKRAFAHTSTTLPSHTSILTGMTPLYHGVHDNSNFIAREDLLTLAEHLKKFGYATGAVVGAYPLDVRFGLNQGFDYYNDDYGNQDFQSPDYVERRAEKVVDKAVEWLDVQTKSWFLWVHCFDPHAPYDAPEPFRTEFKDHPYDGEVAYLDFSLDRLFDYLTSKQDFNKTVIVFTSDHGESLGEHSEETHGYFAYNTSIWVPLIIYIPGAAGIQVDQAVSHADIFPTVCDVLNVKKPEFLQGDSLLTLVQGKKIEENPIYFESLYPYYSRGWAPIKGYISGQEKYIESPIPELYDLNQDFSELINLAEKKDLSSYQSTLSSIIKEKSQLNVSVAKIIDREAREKLRSLGYVSSPQVGTKENFTWENDVKILLPYHNRSSEALYLYQTGKVQQAVNQLRAIIKDNKKIDTSYLNLAKILKETGDLANSLEVLKLGFDHLPSNYDIFLTYVSYLLQAGQYAKVIDVFEKKEISTMRFDPEIWNSAGMAYVHTGYTEKAIEAFKRAASLDNDFPEAYNNLGNVYFFDFQKTKSSRSYQDSLNNYKKAIELDPKYALAFNGLGGTYLIAGQIEGAIFCLEKALELNPGLDYALYNLGYAYLNKGDRTKAVELFEEYKKKACNRLSPSEQRELDAIIQKHKKDQIRF